MSDGRELGWDDEIQNDGPNYILLPEGEYDFEITKFERGRFAGSEKLPACNKATVTVHIETKDGETNIDHSLFLHTKTEGLLCQFFTSIGQRNHGERLNMNWQRVPGARGRCKIYIDKWTDKDGNPRENNKVGKFLEPAVTTQQTMFTPGSF